MIPYGKQSIDETDIDAVVGVLRSDWLTTGPKLNEFETAFAEFCDTQNAIAVSNGTAALHCAMYAAGIGPGDEVLVPAMSFVASSNCVVFQGAKPVFCDVRENDLLIDVNKLESRITPATKAIIAVDYAGMPCDYKGLCSISRKHNLTLVADACHSVGGKYRNLPVGSLADMSVFSFHPAKNMTTGEGGMITTNDDLFAKRVRSFRGHGIDLDFRQRVEAQSWEYQMLDLGWNYRLTDIQCALGISQLAKLPVWVERRNEIAARYDAAFKPLYPALIPVAPDEIDSGTVSGRHLYVIRVPGKTKKSVFKALRAAGIGVNVHYPPIHLHPFYEERFGTGPGLCPVAEKVYAELITLPLFPSMTEEEIAIVIEAVKATVTKECQQC